MISIITVNWNTGFQLYDCINSIASYHDDLVSSVIIVDNASTDSSLQQIEELTNLPFEIKIIKNTENLGFSAACNQGAALAASEELLFLNPDARLLENALLKAHVFIVDPKNEKVGIVGIQLIDEKGQVSRSCARFPSLTIFVAEALGVNRIPMLESLDVHMSSWAHDETKEVDHVIAAFFLMHKSLFDGLGGFDEYFFMYYEDLDFSRRARRLGYSSVYLADVQAFHAGGGASRNIKAKRLFYSLRGRLQYGFKHFSLWQAWGLLSVILLAEPLTRLGALLMQGKVQDAKNTLYAYRMLLYDLPAIIKKGSQYNSRG